MIAVPIVVAVLAVPAVLGLGAQRKRRRRRSHRAAIDDALGFVVDLVAVVLGSGGTVRQAVAAVASHGPEAVRPTFAAAVDRSTSGHRLADAVAEVSVALGPTFHPLVGALLAAEVDGAPVASVLSRLADDVEHRDRWRADATAGRLPVALLPPLVLCLLPAVVVGSVVPLAVVALRQLG